MYFVLNFKDVLKGKEIWSGGRYLVLSLFPYCRDNLNDTSLSAFFLFDFASFQFQ